MSKITIYQVACNKVEGFQEMGEMFMGRLVIDGYSKSTHENYLRQMAKLSLYYGRILLKLETNDLEEDLYFLIQTDSSSQSSFKHLVYGLRIFFLLFDKGELHVCLPKINRPKKTPRCIITFGNEAFANGSMKFARTGTFRVCLRYQTADK